MIKKRDEYIASCSNTYRESQQNKWSQELRQQYEVAKAELESFSGFARKDIERVCAMRKVMFSTTLDNFKILTEDYAGKTSESLKVAAMTPVDGGLESVPGAKIKHKKTQKQQQQQQQQQKQRP